MALTIDNQAALEQSVNELEAEAANFNAAAFAGFGEDFCKAWPIIRKALNIAKLVTPAWVDAVIDAIVAAGDARCQNQS
jgi:hypothetical protein